jgi:hypothetical protein
VCLHLVSRAGQSLSGDALSASRSDREAMFIQQTRAKLFVSYRSKYAEKEVQLFLYKEASMEGNWMGCER